MTIPIRPEDAVNACALAFDVTPEAIRGRARVGFVAAARHTTWALLRERGMPVKDIAEAFDRDPPTVYAALHKWQARMTFRHPFIVRERVEAARTRLAQLAGAQDAGAQPGA